VVHEIPALAAVIKNDEMFIIFGITPGGEAEYKGMFTKTKLQEYAGGSIGLKACSLLIQIYETQGGNADWVARRNAGHCRAETREITSPNGTGTVAILVVADDGQGRGAAVWDDPETDREARSEVAYTLSIFKTKMNELGISVPLTLLG
jgi:hypothetical protein